MITIGDTLHFGWLNQTLTIKNIWIGINIVGSYDCLVSFDNDTNNHRMVDIVNLMICGDIATTKEVYDRLRKAKIVNYLRTHSNWSKTLDCEIVVDDDTLIFCKSSDNTITFLKTKLVGYANGIQFKDLRELKNILNSRLN